MNIYLKQSLLSASKPVWRGISKLNKQDKERKIWFKSIKKTDVDA